MSTDAGELDRARRQAARQRERAWRERQQHTASPHPWPQRGEWLSAVAIAVFVIVLGYALLIAAAAVAPPV